MQRLEITGETPEALYINVINTLSLFLRGPAQTTAAPIPSSDNGSSEETLRGGSTPSEGAKVETRSEPLADEKTTVIPPKKTRGKGAAAKAELNDDISDVGGAGAKTIEHDVKEVNGKPPATLTLDGDIRPRLREIQQACTKRGLDMPATISYIQKLYGPFGIAKAEQLKPEQFVEFMDASEAYLTGEA